MDICLSQLPTIIEEGTAFRVSLRFGLGGWGAGGGGGVSQPQSVFPQTHRPGSPSCPSCSTDSALKGFFWVGGVGGGTVVPLY